MAERNLSASADNPVSRRACGLDDAGAQARHRPGRAARRGGGPREQGRRACPISRRGHGRRARRPQTTCSSLFREQLPEPIRKSCRERSMNREVAGADGSSHELGLGSRREPGMELRPRRLALGEPAMFFRDAVDVALGQRPHRVVVRDHCRDEILDFAAGLVVGQSQMPTRGSVGTIIPHGPGSPISMSGTARRRRSVSAATAPAGRRLHPRRYPALCDPLP